MNGLVWSVPPLKRERPSGDNAAYLYKGSKVRNLVGGSSPSAAGIHSSLSMHGLLRFRTIAVM